MATFRSFLIEECKPKNPAKTTRMTWLRSFKKKKAINEVSKELLTNYIKKRAHDYEMANDKAKHASAKKHIAAMAGKDHYMVKDVWSKIHKDAATKRDKLKKNIGKALGKIDKAPNQTLAQRAKLKAKRWLDDRAMKKHLYSPSTKMPWEDKALNKFGGQFQAR